jgi:hypothetical protein
VFDVGLGFTFGFSDETGSCFAIARYLVLLLFRPTSHPASCS